MILQLMKVHFTSTNTEVPGLEKKEDRECSVEKSANSLIKMNEWIQIISI
jgi:hypothetical protein